MSDFVEIPASKKSLAFRKPVFGVGVNDASYNVTSMINGKQIICPYYKVWKHMLERCYDKKLHQKRPSYIDCLVCEEWLVFSSFKSWMRTKDWIGLSLDKDIKVIGNKIYSPDTCLFVSSHVNSIFAIHRASIGCLPVGVCLDRCSGKYIAQCGSNRKKKNFGLYSTPEHTHSAYKEFKIQAIIETANFPENARIKEHLINYSKAYATDG